MVTLRQSKQVLATLFSCALATITLPASAEGDAALNAAKDLFNRYVELEHNFDVAQADLYAQDAVIKNTRLYPGGQNRTLSINGADYKRLIRATLPLAKMRNDLNQYTGVTYCKEGNAVRIKCSRYSQLKQYSSPMEIVVAPSGSSWLIVSETSQSRP